MPNEVPPLRGYTSWHEVKRPNEEIAFRIIFFSRLASIHVLANSAFSAYGPPGKAESNMAVRPDRYRARKSLTFGKEAHEQESYRISQDS